MKNKKGFTLIELLAVIVILAIIALIAVPIVLNMINSARRSAARTSSLNLIDAIEYYAGLSEIDNTGMDLSGYPEKLPRATKTVGTTTSNVNVTCTYDGSAWATTVESGANLVTAAEDCTKFFSPVDGVFARSKGKTPDEATIILDFKGKVQNGSSLKYGGYTCSYNGTDISNCTKN